MNDKRSMINRNPYDLDKNNFSGDYRAKRYHDEPPHLNRVSADQHPFQNVTRSYQDQPNNLNPSQNRDNIYPKFSPQHNRPGPGDKNMHRNSYPNTYDKSPDFFVENRPSPNEKMYQNQRSNPYQMNLPAHNDSNEQFNHQRRPLNYDNQSPRFQQQRPPFEDIPQNNRNVDRRYSGPVNHDNANLPYKGDQRSQQEFPQHQQSPINQPFKPSQQMPQHPDGYYASPNNYNNNNLRYSSEPRLPPSQQYDNLHDKNIYGQNDLSQKPQINPYKNHSGYSPHQMNDRNIYDNATLPKPMPQHGSNIQPNQHPRTFEYGRYPYW